MELAPKPVPLAHTAFAFPDDVIVDSEEALLVNDFADILPFDLFLLLTVIGVFLGAMVTDGATRGATWDLSERVDSRVVICSAAA